MVSRSQEKLSTQNKWRKPTFQLKAVQEGNMLLCRLKKISGKEKESQTQTRLGGDKLVETRCPAIFISNWVQVSDHDCGVHI